VKSVVKMKRPVHFFRFLRILFWSLGGLFLFFVVMALTPLPFYAWYNYSLSKAGIHRPPDYIIVLGGGGMPSETGLMRCWYGAKAANYFTRAKVIIALPGDANDSLSSVNLMKKELVMRGVAKERIILEDSGTNTRAQAVNIFRLTIYNLRFTNESSIVNRQSSILLVTGPEHLPRAVLSFLKAGFSRIDGLPAFESTIESDITFNDCTLGGRKWIPGIGENLNLRYHFWTQLRYEELLMREWMAMIYYKLKGWI
jgi:uncharacterized SAM-binding protein YcdF (DUF218 family)